jgi:hypothetical protein
VQQFGDDFLVTLGPASCLPLGQYISVQPRLNDDQLDVQVANNSPASAVATPPIANTIWAGDQRRRFVEPLFVPAGEQRTVTRLMPLPADFDGPVELEMPQFGLSGSYSFEPAPAERVVLETPSATLNIGFGEVLTLNGFSLAPYDDPGCRVTGLDLYWEPGTLAGVGVQVQVVDKLGLPVVTSRSQFEAAEPLVDGHFLPLIETLPAGRYGLLVSVVDRSGEPLLPENIGERLVVGSAVLVGDLWVRPPPPPSGTGSNLSAESVAAFENRIVLRGYRLDKTSASPGDWLRLTLYWQAETPVSEDLTVFTQLLDRGGQVYGQQDNPPRAGSYPTVMWRPGEIVSDDYLLKIDPMTPPGILSLHVGLYRPDSLIRILTTTGVDHVIIAGVTVTD